MTPEQYAQVCDLFQAAAPLDAAAQARLLDQACDGNAWLRGEVEKMLAGDAQDTNTDPVANSPLILKLNALLPNGRWLREYIGERIGPYVIERKLGSGGMGTVYLARRTGDFQQQVAIKLIKAGLDGQHTIARFRTERQVLANLNHPHIARLFDGGATDDGLPYFVMEYIEGQPLDRYCADQQLPLAARIRLLKSIAEAVHYAHERRVLHRDLKPGNLLVTADGLPKIVDFGLAKHVAAWQADGAKNSASGGQTVCADSDLEEVTLPPSSLTQTGAILGTPSYMAPEQADPGNRALGPPVDVYALGAVLYELLTGRPPFRGESPLDTLFQVVHDDPVPPSQLHPRLPRDLETICLKCLQKEAGQRYPSAAELAAELERFLEHKPILARPASLWSRAGRFARRNKLLVGSTAAVVAALVLGLAGTASGLLRAWDAERKLQSELLTALERAATSAAQRGDWREALRSYDDALAAGHPHDIDLRLKRVRVLAALNRKQEARSELAALTQGSDLERSQEALLLLFRGDLALSRFGDAAEALADIRAARDLGLEPGEDAYARALLADTMPQALSHVQESLHQKALCRDPFHREAQNLQLMLLLMLGKLEDCKARAQTLASLTPEEPAPRVCLAWVTLFEGRTPEARNQLASLRNQLGTEQIQSLDGVFEILGEMLQALSRGDAFSTDEAALGRAFLRIKEIPAKLTKEADLDVMGMKLIKLPAMTNSWGAFAASLAQAELGQIQPAIDVMEKVVAEHPEGVFHYWHGHLMMELAGDYAGVPSKKDQVPALAQRAERAFHLAAQQTSLFARLGRDARFWGAWVQSLLAKSRDRKPDGEARGRAIRNMHWMIAENHLRSVGECRTLAGLALERLEDTGLARSIIAVGDKLDPNDLDLRRIRARVELAAGAFGPALEAVDYVLAYQPNDEQAKRLRQEIIEKRETAQKPLESKP